MNEYSYLHQYLLNKRSTWATSQRQTTYWGPNATRNDAVLAKAYVRQHHEDDLIAEFRADIANAWHAVCSTLTTLSKDHILDVVTTVFELADPEIGDIGELITVALLIGCDLPTGWWKQYWPLVAIFVGIPLAGLVGWRIDVARQPKRRRS